MDKLSPKGFWKVIRLTFKDFSRDNISKKSAALAYYTIFSLPGMLLVVVTILDMVYGREASQGAVQHGISSFVGSAAALQIQELIQHAAVTGKTSLAAIAGVVTLLIGATKMFGEIQDSINLIWNLRAKPKRGWIRLLVNRLISFSMVITLGFLLLVSLIISGIVLLFSKHLAAYFPGLTLIFVSLVNLFLSFFITACLFVIIFKVLPDAKIRWADVIVGAIVTTVLFMIGKSAIGFYLGKSNVESAYGAAGSIIIILLWIYYSAMILYLGAAFTKEYALHFGRHIRPVNAVWVQEVEVAAAINLQQISRASDQGHLKREEK